MSENVLSVAELNRRARQAIERALPLLWVAGEISNLVRAASGHLYFTLKDEEAQVRCVMFRSRANLLPWQIANGQQIEARALASLYEARGDFQLNVESMRRGAMSRWGRLYEAFARLRAALEAEGLFAAERKRPLPAFPRSVGIVTSLQAAALRDIVAACKRRAPHLPLIVFPTPVQGDGAAAQIAQAINTASEMAKAGGRCDVLIVARGGGSIEDLWSFNDEAVARAINACSIPVISGVGHETDITIADFAADHRAATPTAAAELVTARWHAAAGELRHLDDCLQRLMRRRIESHMQRVDSLARCLLHPRQRLEKTAMEARHLALRLDAALHRQISANAARVGTIKTRLLRQHPNTELKHSMLLADAKRLQQAMRDSLLQHRHRVANAADALKLLDPNATLARGYCIARDPQGQTIIDGTALQVGDEVALQFARGGADARISRTR